jgi:amino acid permease (GABA permease)
MSVSDRGGSHVTHAGDQQRLHELGYAQELARKMGWFSNFAVSFTIISILTGGITTFFLAMAAGGPVAIAWGWPIVGIAVLLVGLAMGEVCSSYPTAGGLYYWAAKLAPPKTAPVWSWFTGWFNLMGQVAVTASIDYGLATFIGFFLQLTVWSDFRLKPGSVLVIYGLVLLLHALLNIFGVTLVARLNDISVWWHLIGGGVIVAFLILLPDNHQSVKTVFTHFENSTGWSFPASGLYVFFIGMLLAQYTLTGYDASAHMTEETHDAARSGPKGIVTSIWVSVVAGYILLMALTFAVPSSHKFADYAGGTTSAGQLMIDAIGSTGGKLLILISIGAQLFCGMASITANSRMIYAFSRDGAIPGSKTWHRINPRTRTPTNSIWFAAGFAFLLGVPSLITNKAGVSVAFFAIVSIAVVGLYISYIIPVFLRLLAGDRFEPGPWQLGRWSKPVGWVATIWVVIICVMFLLPQFAPVSRNNFNYAPIAVLAVMGFAGLYWLVSAHKWFTGPKVQGTPEELAAIEAELAALESGR